MAKQYNEKEAVAARRVFLAGMSQGAMMSLYVQLTKLDYDLGGVMLHSGSLVAPLQQIVNGEFNHPEQKLSAPGKNMKFLFYHGAADKHFLASTVLPSYTKLLKQVGANKNAV